MIRPTSAARARPDYLMLASCRARQLQNLLRQQVRTTPWRSAAVLMFLAIIWGALYVLLLVVFRIVRNWGMVSFIADQHIFVHFFLMLGIMLVFSNAILAFSTLYGRSEAGHLLTLPVHARHVVFVKLLEGLLLSSWSFLLSGVPLMLAFAHNAEVRWYYYPLFLAHFVCFIVIPACVGLLAACSVALWAPRRPLRVALLAGAVLIVLGAAWLVSVARGAKESEEWMRVLLGQLSLAKQPLSPNTWTASGILAAVHGDAPGSLFYLLVVLANGVFLSWLTINVLAQTWSVAFSRASQGRRHPVIRRGWITRAMCAPFRLVMPLRLQRVILKDLRYFARDPKQWTQMVIMFGLLVIYVSNLGRLPQSFDIPAGKSVMTFLNLTTVSLILATFTSRFVFPLLSLESRQLWLLELLPIRRSTLLLVKFVFALALTGLSACLVMGLAVYMLNLPATWAAINLVLCFSMCVGLSGLAVGLGARFPSFGERNPARIAAGFGGTFNLIASMAFVSLELIGVAMLSFAETQVVSAGLALPAQLSREGWLMLAGLVGLGFVVAGGALGAGAHHFNRLET
jgi:ABC-2 type transport system permease protein